ncbi:MAG: hypothetical protein HZC29_02465 [Thaumarchaeota archaeon]|nr:hypothetical protein [Nitrososphaerota archaeon]
MNSKLWLDGIDGIIPGGITVEDFAVVTKTVHSKKIRIIFTCLVLI